MVTRTPGPFDYYSERFGGVTGDSIRESVDPLDGSVAELGQVADDLTGDGNTILHQVEGQVLADTHRPPVTSAESARALAATSAFGIGCVRRFAQHADSFDTEVNTCNTRYASLLDSMRHDPDTRDSGASPAELRADALGIVRPDYNAALATLDDRADEVAAQLRDGPDNEAVRQMIRDGLIPLSAAAYFPTLVLTAEDRSKAYDAQVEAIAEQLRQEGLLPHDAPVTGLYREWLLNTARNGVPLEEVIAIARDHDVRPDDFEVFDGAERVIDNDGKSYFILPTDISGDDARNAVWLTYVLNAGTGYGSADGSSGNNFTETPYSSQEVQRILDRQEENSWSYRDNVGFVHGNGGRLATTPNGMMMGLGGNLIQDQFSLSGGTTWGDAFMVNIDDTDDPAQTLRDNIRDGYSWGQWGADPGRTNQNLDLDRLLHHEERHSQQWAEYGYAGFGARYLNELVEVDWPGWGPFRAPVPRMAEGHENDYEVDAGLEDGGYHR